MSDLATGQNLAVNSLALGGFEKTSGTWGSTSSTATYQDDNYFAGTGYVTVRTDSRLTQTITFSTIAPSRAVVAGPTYTPTATGGAPDPLTALPEQSAATFGMGDNHL